MTDRSEIDDHDELLDAQLAESEAEWGRDLRTSLVELLAVPDDLTTRTAAGLGDALLTRSTLATAVDLLGLGWHTLRHLAGGADPTTEVPR